MKRFALLAVILSALAGCSLYPCVLLFFVTKEREVTICVFEAATNKVVDTIVTGGRPRGIVISFDGTRAYVALSTPINAEPRAGDSRIAVIDTSNGKQLASIDAGDDPEQLAVDSAQNYLYVSNEDSGTASIIDLHSGKSVASLVTGIEPEGVVISPDGRWVYVMAETSSTVTVIDTQERTVVKTFMVGVRPRSAAFSPDGRRSFINS